MRFRTFLAGTLVVALLPVAAHAARITHLGPRAGFAFDPDQFTFGGQMDIGPLAEDFTFNPNLELGVGDDMTVVALNLDGQYHLNLQNSNVRPYFGAGLGVNFFSWDGPPGSNGDNSDTELGMNLIAGLGFPMQNSNRFFTELRFGIGDIPDLKLMAGWGFPL
jgi:hypothetical protein